MTGGADIDLPAAGQRGISNDKLSFCLPGVFGMKIYVVGGRAVASFAIDIQDRRSFIKRMYVLCI